MGSHFYGTHFLLMPLLPKFKTSIFDYKLLEIMELHRDSGELVDVCRDV